MLSWGTPLPRDALPVSHLRLALLKENPSMKGIFNITLVKHKDSKSVGRQRAILLVLMKKLFPCTSGSYFSLGFCQK